jgi:hypothetical protein
MILIVSSASVHGQAVPTSLKQQLDGQFPGWRFVQYSLPEGCIEGDEYPLDAGAKSFYVCRLNRDSLADYALAIDAGEGDSLREYFLAAVAVRGSYNISIVDSSLAHKGAGHRYLLIIRAGSQINIFGEDTVLSAVGKVTSDGVFISFDVDVLQVFPICESYYKAVEVESYVLIDGVFRSFTSAD